MDEKKSALQQMLKKTTNVYDKVQRGINTAADRMRSKPLPATASPVAVFNTTKDLPGRRRPIMPDTRTRRPMPYPAVPPSERPVNPNPIQRPMPGNKPSMPGTRFSLPVVTKPGIISKPTIGSIKRPV